MDKLLSIFLPFPPSVNNLFSTAKHGKRFITPRYKKWRAEALQLIMVARIKQISGHVNVRVALSPPTKARRDVDNYSKALLDALVAGHVLAYDSQVQELTSRWDRDRDRIGAFIEIDALAVAA
jgi:crossover junction endodeoxyribonuclease RusA